jgi:RHS repeat-associated protein
MGRRISKAVYDPSDLSSPTSDLRYTYDGWNLISEISSQGSEFSTNYYTWGLDLSGSMQGAGGIGGLLACHAVDQQGAGGSTVCFYAYDANGNVTDLVDTNGTTVGHYEYDAFGNTTVKTGTMADANPFRFSTKYLDTETELYYYGLRYYSPELGRWVSRDPIGEKGGYNLYDFIDNNGIYEIDLLGLLGIGDLPWEEILQAIYSSSSWIAGEIVALDVIRDAECPSECQKTLISKSFWRRHTSVKGGLRITGIPGPGEVWPPPLDRLWELLFPFMDLGVGLDIAFRHYQTSLNLKVYSCCCKKGFAFWIPRFRKDEFELEPQEIDLGAFIVTTEVKSVVTRKYFTREPHCARGCGVLSYSWNPPGGKQLIENLFNIDLGEE